MIDTTQRPHVGYVLKMFPRLSETFVLNELLELERQGTQLSIFSLMYPNDGRFHGRLAELRASTQYFPVEKPDNLWSAIRALPEAESIPLARWQEAADFLRRHAIPKDLDLLLRSVLISAQVRRRGVEHLHAHFATVATRVAALVHLLTGVPFSFTAHAKDIFRETVDRNLFAELVSRSAFTVTVSDFNRSYILRHTPSVQADKIVRLYNGIDLRFFSPGSPAERNHRDTPHIVSVGRLVPKKGFDHLLRALHTCRERSFRFTTTIVGDGEMRGALTELCSQLGLANCVTFTGALTQESLRDLLANASITALACVADADGNMDALPTVLLESLALDIPIVSTRLTGVPEIVDAETGVLTDPGDVEGLAQALQSMCARVRDGRQREGACRARAEALFDLRTNVGSLRGAFARSAVEARP